MNLTNEYNLNKHWNSNKIIINSRKKWWQKTRIMPSKMSTIILALIILHNRIELFMLTIKTAFVFQISRMVIWIKKTNKSIWVLLLLSIIALMVIISIMINPIMPKIIIQIAVSVKVTNIKVSTTMYWNQAIET